ncbi:hypothetical protein FJT64_005543 [Amphibalanus amphitrite]|uniref:Uncharacterized protein n=1 Tax=Amphibalanus amphitrite TaxID=1232801 RepID=A0A6A4VVW9_AMPAM|nr:hypothetical protein FJT64_005543 [Amphibalanus amphitrite]
MGRDPQSGDSSAVRRLRRSRRRWQTAWDRQAARLGAGQPSALEATRCRLFVLDLPLVGPLPPDPLTRRQRDRVEALLAGRTLPTANLNYSGKLRH